MSEIRALRHELGVEKAPPKNVPNIQSQLKDLANGGKDH